jgi:hypothetical protein
MHGLQKLVSNSTCAATARRRQATILPGKAVQVDPINPTLKAPGKQALKLQYDKAAFNLCFQIQLTPLHPAGGDHEVPVLDIQ